MAIPGKGAVVAALAGAAGTELYNRGQRQKGGNLQGAHFMEVLIGGGMALLTEPGDLPSSIGLGVAATGIAGMLRGA